MEEPVLINDAGVTDKGYLVDTEGNESFHLHGGVVTRITYDHIESMDLESFLKVEVPKLSKQSKDMCVLRNAAAGSFTFILGDRVIVYRTTDVVECTQKEMVDRMKTMDDTEQEFIPDIQYPLVARVSWSDKLNVIVRMESRHVVYKNPDLRGLGQVDIWLPPIWFRVTMSKARGVLGAGVAAVPQAKPRADSTVLYGMRLGNMWPENGVICLGTSRVEVPLGENPTEGEIVESTFARVFGSNFVNHITIPRDNEIAAAQEAYSGLPEEVKKKFEPLIKNNGSTASATLLRLLAVLSTPGGWMGYPWSKLNGIDAKQFIRDRQY